MPALPRAAQAVVAGEWGACSLPEVGGRARETEREREREREGGEGYRGLGGGPAAAARIPTVHEHHPPVHSTKSQEQLLRRNVKRFRGRLEFKAHRRVYHSTLGRR